MLAPGGVLGLVRNVRDRRRAWVQALCALTEPHAGDAPSFESGAWRRALPAPGFIYLREKTTPHVHEGSPEQVVIGRTLSVSYTAALSDPARDAVRQALEELVRTDPDLRGRDRVEHAYTTSLFAFRKFG